MPLTLVTDRTQADVDRLLYLRKKQWAGMSETERAEWLSDSAKGGYNFTDLNRVEAAVELLASELTELGFSVPVSVKADWNQWDIPSVSAMDCYIRNLAILRNAVNVFRTITVVPPTTMQHLDFNGANRIERMLQQIEGWIIDMQNNRRYTGESFCGE